MSADCAGPTRPTRCEPRFFTKGCLSFERRSGTGKPDSPALCLPQLERVGSGRRGRGVGSLTIAGLRARPLLAGFLSIAPVAITLSEAMHNCIDAGHLYGPGATRTRDLSLRSRP